MKREQKKNDSNFKNSRKKQKEKIPEWKSIRWLQKMFWCFNRHNFLIKTNANQFPSVNNNTRFGHRQWYFSECHATNIKWKHENATLQLFSRIIHLFGPKKTTVHTIPQTRLKFAYQTRHVLFFIQLVGEILLFQVPVLGVRKHLISLNKPESPVCFFSCTKPRAMCSFLHWNFVVFALQYRASKISQEDIFHHSHRFDLWISNFPRPVSFFLSLSTVSIPVYVR